MVGSDGSYDCFLLTTPEEGRSTSIPTSVLTPTEISNTSTSPTKSSDKLSEAEKQIRREREKRIILILLGSLFAAACVIAVSKYMYSKYRRSYNMSNFEMNGH
ncbi:uncharacterized protein LOC131850564 [Achroia grisella]|uniref:uncharacterized protein LOC131850564 n=1 Tax=Achroia grisella TaxID=688607 RepID=UPI0027D2AE12|nr:uncharacterized protein LOC131850564 [Achroia grisella]